MILLNSIGEVLAGTMPALRPRTWRMALRYEACLSVVTRSGLWPTVAIAYLKKALADGKARFSLCAEVKGIGFVLANRPHIRREFLRFTLVPDISMRIK